MAKVIFLKFNDVMNLITLLFIICGGMIMHTLTALTLKSYYGDPWGYVAFLFPGFAEAYLVVVQLEDSMYNYTLLLAGFICTITVAGLFWMLRNFVRTRLATLHDNKA